MKTSTSTVIALLVISSVALGAEATRLVTAIPKPYPIAGCAWSASAQAMGRDPVHLAELDDSRALMHIDGTNVELRLVEKRGSLDKVGDTLEKTYRSASIQVRARYVATWVCPENDESCEVTKYTVTFEVSKGTRQQIIEATGDVGC